MVSVNSKKDNKINLFEAGAGIGAGYATYTQARRFGSRPYSRFITKQLEKLPESDNIRYAEAAKTAFASEKLSNKGIKIIDISDKNFDSFVNEMKENIKRYFNKIRSKISIKNNKLGQLLEKHLKNLEEKRCLSLEASLYSILFGENAAYFPCKNAVVVNPNKMGFATFHELGHAINNNSKGFVKALVKTRNHIRLLAPIILFTSIIKKKKPEDQKPKNIWDRFTTFIKNNCGKLMFLTMIPTIIEEGLASYNGHKLGKKVLKPDMLKKMNKLNFVAWGSYVLGATLMATCGALAVWIKDRVTQPELAVKKTT